MLEDNTICRYDGKPVDRLPFPEFSHEDWLEIVLKSEYQRSAIEDQPPDPGIFFQNGNLARVVSIRQEQPNLVRAFLTWLRKQGVHIPDYLQALDAYESQAASVPPTLQTATELIHEEIPPLTWLAHGLLHEGLWIFGGKSKRGKSWLMLDLALAIAAGRAALGHFSTRKAAVLYLALEDSRRRVKDRMLQIEPAIASRDSLYLAYSWPTLQNGAVDHFRRMMVDHAVRLVIIDVAAKLVRRPIRNSDAYLDAYDDLGQLQMLCAEFGATIVLIDHLRKADADDVFDAIQGSVGKQGVCDGLLVMDRKAEEEDAYLHVRSKESRDATHAIRFDGARFAYVGEGEEFAKNKDYQEIREIMTDASGPITINELLLAMGKDRAGYQRVRREVLAMEKEGMVYRARVGKPIRFGLTMRAEWHTDIEI